MNENKIHVSIFREVTGDTIESDWCEKYVDSLIQSLAKIIKKRQENVAQLALNMDPKPAQDEPEYWLWDKMLHLMPENIIGFSRDDKGVEIKSTAENGSEMFFCFKVGGEKFKQGLEKK